MSKEISKLLSLVLRHAPERLGIELDAKGWTSVPVLLSKMKKAGYKLDAEQLQVLVDTNDKKRFTLSADGKHIRAAQGHSVSVNLGLAATVPPAILYHGTASANLDSIFQSGLKPGSRQQVHLSSDTETAMKVGQRHGRPVVLTVDTRRMHSDGYSFYRADNGVWLTDHVPPGYLTF